MGETQRVLCCFQLESLFLKYKLVVTVSMREKGRSMTDAHRVPWLEIGIDAEGSLLPTGVIVPA